jgi:hypothetical protein
MFAIAFLLAAAPAAATPVADTDPLVCRRDLATGTRFARKVCRKRSVWEAMAERDGRALTEMRGNSVARDTGRN